jgi:hypothetical protein
LNEKVPSATGYPERRISRILGTGAASVSPLSKRESTVGNPRTLPLGAARLFADWRAQTAAVVTIFVTALTFNVTAVAEEIRPSVEAPRYGACVAQHPKNFRVACGGLRQAFKAETMARHGYLDTRIADPPGYCRAQVLWQIEQLGKAMKEDSRLQAMVRNNYRKMYSECLAVATKKNSDLEIVNNRKINEDNSECIAQTVENAYLGRIRTPNEFYTQCMAALGWPGQWLE